MMCSDVGTIGDIPSFGRTKYKRIFKNGFATMVQTATLRLARFNRGVLSRRAK